MLFAEADWTRLNGCRFFTEQSPLNAIAGGKGTETNLRITDTAFIKKIKQKRLR